MYKLTHQFTFQAVHTSSIVPITAMCTNEAHMHHFTGSLIFTNKMLNQFGTLHTENELRRFADVLNSLTNLPESWSLELIAKELYNHGVSMFPDLKSIVIYMTDAPFRTAEFSQEGDELIVHTGIEAITDGSPIN